MSINVDTTDKHYTHEGAIKPDDTAAVSFVFDLH